MFLEERGGNRAPYEMRECHCHFVSAGSELPSADLGQEVITATATIIFSNVQSCPSHALRLPLAGKGTEMSSLRNKNSPEMRARWIQSLPQLYPPGFYQEMLLWYKCTPGCGEYSVMNESHRWSAVTVS